MAQPLSPSLDVTPVLLSGGAGTRLWPLSRQLLPKQYHTLLGPRSLMADTLLRLQNILQLNRLSVICHQDHRFLVAEQLRAENITPSAILLEPQSRNTAPAVAVATLEILARREGDPVLLILPADHAMQEPDGLAASLAGGAELARQGYLVIFGIPPRAPETGYGYIQTGTPLGSPEPFAWTVARFVEKPNHVDAQRMLDSGQFLWNSGMVMARASRMLQALEQHVPEIVRHAEDAVAKMTRDLDFMRPEPKAFGNMPNISLDYAVMEKDSQVAVVPMEVGWNDVGSWQALWETLPKDENGNALRGDVVAMDMRNSLAVATSRMVGVLGVEEMVVVETADAVLVMPRHRAQDLRILVERLRQQQREVLQGHQRVFRPWGSYECIDRAEHFQVKRITVHPGAALSLQRHQHRAEHWIVVSGVARVTRAEEVIVLQENQSTYIPVGVKHRLENPGQIPLKLIEVQSGSYLGEDDIERFDDLYGR